jgi:hypothetical protein
LLNPSLNAAGKALPVDLEEAEEGERLMVADIMSHIQVLPQNLVFLLCFFFLRTCFDCDLPYFRGEKKTLDWLQQ